MRRGGRERGSARGEAVESGGSEVAGRGGDVGARNRGGGGRGCVAVGWGGRPPRARVGWGGVRGKELEEWHRPIIERSKSNRTPIAVISPGCCALQLMVVIKNLLRAWVVGPTPKTAKSTTRVTNLHSRSAGPSTTRRMIKS